MLLDSIKLCVFDMAGTTVDEQNIVYKTLHQVIQIVIQEEDFSVTLEEVLEHGAGKEKHQAIIDTLSAIAPHADIDIETLANKAFQLFKPALEKAYREHSVMPINGVEALFQELKTRKIYVVLNTGYSRSIAEGLLEKLRWSIGGQIDALITADDVTNGRPAPDMIHLAMHQVGVADSSTVLKAGDSAIDIVEGKNANCGITVGVLTGAQTQAQLESAEPDIIVETLTDLLTL